MHAPMFGLDKEAFKTLETVEVVIHLGGYTPKQRGDENNIAGCTSNIAFTTQLFDLPMKMLKKVIYISTLDVYPQADYISEALMPDPISLYGWSKLYCEHLATVFAKQKSLIHHVLRIGHVYGPGEEKYSKVLPNAIRNIIQNKPLELWGDGSDLRSFIHIDDVITAIIKSVSLNMEVGVINVVGNQPISIKTLLETLITISGKDIPIIKREFTGAKRDCVFDTTKLSAHLLPKQLDFVTGLRDEYAYFQRLK